MECGGNNMILLETACKDVSPIIKECMICSAATIDEFVETIPPKTRNADSWCIAELSLKLAESYIEGDIAKVAIDLIPGAGVVAGCIMAGIDLYSTIKLAHEYDMCRINRVS